VGFWNILALVCAAYFLVALVLNAWKGRVASCALGALVVSILLYGGVYPLLP
jgi:hypothetical protein